MLVQVQQNAIMSIVGLMMMIIVMKCKPGHKRELVLNQSSFDQKKGISS
jgi:hypothetical protein